MMSFIAVVFMTMLAVSTAGPVNILTRTSSHGDFPDFGNFGGPSTISCYNTDPQQTTSLVNCPGFATKCATAGFDMNVPFSKSHHVPAYFCATDDQCSNAGSDFCQGMADNMPVPIENCQVICCGTNNCNIPK
ncbi:uncharacterized protein LOC143446937 [Clavelina lepadiformis]|uniref:uncharacterized protein LOC143446937 n=1 Tax=Clavelina lepadiformis TaxID=159417 RepID=UPI00404324FA